MWVSVCAYFHLQEIEEWLTAILKVKESGEGQEDAKTELSTSKHDCLLSADDALAEDREEKIVS